MIIQTNKPLPPRRELDFYPTPDHTIYSAAELLAHYMDDRWKPKTILDPGCGDGPWGRIAKAIWPCAIIDGVDIRHTSAYEYYDAIWTDDFSDGRFQEIYRAERGQADLIWGNPPYKYAEEFVRHGLDLLAPGGYVLYLLRLAFAEGQKRRDGLFRDYPPLAVGVCGKRPSFQEDGKTNATAFGLFLWRKHWQGVSDLRFL